MQTTSRLALSAVLVAGLGATPLLAAPEGWAPLLEPAELSALLDEHGDDIRVIHVTGEFQKGHIPDAGYAPYHTWRSDDDNPGALREVAHWESILRELGVEAETPVVVVHAGVDPSDMGAAARVYWTLKSLGVQDLALLNGGFEGWASAGLPVSTSTPGGFMPSDFEANWSDEWRVTTEEVVELAEAGDTRLIDARPTDFFSGLQWSIAAPGTIRNSNNLTYEAFFDGNRMLGAEVVRELAEREGYTDAPLTVSFCNTGHWAAINWFALSELAEIPNTRLYAESMAEYAAGGHALDNAPNRVVYFWRATSRWVTELF